MVWVFGMMGIDGWLLSCGVVMLWTLAPFFWSIRIRCIYYFFSIEDERASVDPVIG
jgi:hypothetical protein